ncbi:ABC transporter substrate-binding protein [Limimaricola pyoseonensis]|uniref:Carbohydrate ABC transporter substrate-binding protein, CUT1 family n=1 Tax=Limimaricola pyoseonensis TaxID=521013 RepID=A0A1G7HR23_9RHOB|nr:sugar ABC transporter substrate-binding protein [Limimaricola pyoseonensis]SDF02967.1 carbohydrate ABC transporter substrate-binding protein, CUT1 family [Limimaricola pyoseonensis]
MKRLLTTSTAALLLAGPAFAQEVTLQFWDNQQTESGLSQYQQEAVDRFMQENPEIRVEVTTIPYPEYQQRLLTAVQGGNAPDIATLDQIWTGAFAAAGALVPLDERAEAAGVSRDAFFGGAWDSAVYEDGLYGIPFNVDVWQFSFFNRALLEEAGVAPERLATFEGLREAAEALSGEGRFGVGLFGHQGEDTVVVANSFIFSNGGQVLAEDGSCALDEPAAVEALQYLQELSQFAPSGILNASSGDMRELFLNGSLAIEFWPALEQPTLQASDIDWGFAVGTAPEGETPVGTFGGWNLSVFESSEHKDAAWKFIEFLTREDVNGDVVDLIPANVAAAESFLAANREGADRIMAHLENAAPRPLSPHYLQIADAQMDLYQDIYSGAEVAAAAEEACARIDQLR